jgi:(S)-2-hydroxyglutarate dehydrogenase
MIYDYIVVGGGIVGASLAMNLSQNFRNKNILIVEKEKELAFHQTGRNSGVIHSGIYYKPGSLKAKNCLEGYDLLLKFCNDHNIDFDICGKLIVAFNESEIPVLNDLYERGIENGLKNLELLDSKQILDYEPNCIGLKAIRVSQTGIINYKTVTEKMGDIFIQNGGKIIFDNEVKNISEDNNFVTVSTNKNKFLAKRVINCGGLFSDKLAGMLRDINVKIIPFRGEYYKLKKSKEHLVKNLIYPVPDPNFPFLGVHFTRMIGGGIEAGPNAVLAFSKEGYSFWNFKFSEFFEILFFRGFIRVAFKYWRMGAMEMYRSLSKTAFTNSLQKLVPSIEKDDLVKCDSGVRAQACDAKGNLIDDFLILNDNNIINVVNAPSPAATSAISIANHIIKLLKNNSNEK